MTKTEAQTLMANMREALKTHYGIEPAEVGETGYDEEGNPQIHMMVDATDLVLTMQSEGTFEQPMYYAELYNTEMGEVVAATKSRWVGNAVKAVFIAWGI